LRANDDKSNVINEFSFKKAAFRLSARGLGSYLEIFNNWDLGDYETFLTTLNEDKING
jgi:hypothetical protein